MAKKTYTEEYRRHLVSLVRAGRTAESLAKEFEPSAPTIRAWVEAETRRGVGATPEDDKARIKALERQVAELEEEREILKKAAAWFAKESGSSLRKGTRS